MSCKLGVLWIAAMSLAIALAGRSAGAEQSEARLQKTTGPVKLAYAMPFDGYATLVIEDEQGLRVRNLIGMAPRGKGEQTDYWDFKGEDGRLVSPGKYRWRGLLHNGIDPTYGFTFGTPNPQGAWDATADPDDETRVFAGGSEYKLDYKAGKATVVAGGLGDVPGQLMKVQGREYFMNRNGKLFLRTGKTFRPAATIAWFFWKELNNYADYPVAFAQEVTGAHTPRFSTSFLWMDLNDDGKVQDEEMTVASRGWASNEYKGKSATGKYPNPPDWKYPFGVTRPSGNYWLDENFNLYCCGYEGDYYYYGSMGPVMWRVPLKSWTPGGAPIWDIKDQQLVTGQMKVSIYDGGVVGPYKGFEVRARNGQCLFSKGEASTGARVYLPAEGKVVVGPPITGIRDDGTIMWTYREDWPDSALWFDKNAPVADRDDLIIAARGCSGRAKTKLGTIFAIHSRVGRMHLMSVDGLLIGSIFQDFRAGEPWPNEARPGMSLAKVSMGGEWAGGHFFKAAKSDEFYLITGGGDKTAYNVIKLNGMESLAAIPGGEVTATEKELHPGAPAIAKRPAAPALDASAGKKALAFNLAKATLKDATLTPTKDGAAMTIAIKGNQQDWAGVELPAAGGKWDLSKYRFVVAQVRNLGANPVKVNLRLDNSNAAAVADGQDVDPRSGWLWTKVGIRRPADAVKVKLFGMAEYPWGRPYEALKTGADIETNDRWWFNAYPWGRPIGKADGAGIDPASVVKLVISVANPKEDCTLEIRDICAAGAAPPAELFGNPAKFFPCIDEFGQYIHADWPGKVYEIADMKKQREAEAKDLAANPGPEEWDQYGGWKNGPALEATDGFHPIKHEGKWWLVNPDGKLFFSNGISGVGSQSWEGWSSPGGDETDETPIQDREAWFSGLTELQADFPECLLKNFGSVKWSGHYSHGPVKTSFDFARANNLRKYGNTYDSDSARIAHRRVRSWGMNTLGIHSSRAIAFQKKTPYIMCARWTPDEKLGLAHPRMDNGVFWDVFPPGNVTPPFIGGSGGGLDALIRNACGDSSRRWRIGIIVDEAGRGDPPLDMGKDDTAYALAALRQPHEPPKLTPKTNFVAGLTTKYATIEKLNEAWGTKHASWDALLGSREAPPDLKKAHDDLAAFNARAFALYFQNVGSSVRYVTGNGLYLGAVLDETASPSIVAAAAKHCDLLCFRLNRISPADFKLPDGIDKPVLIVGFGFSALDRGMLAGDLPDQTARSAAYKEFVLGALKNPQIVGCHWSQYRDYPASGRTRDEANYNAGFVDVADTPYAEMVQAAREVGKTMYKTRLEAK